MLGIGLGPSKAASFRGPTPELARNRWWGWWRSTGWKRGPGCALWSTVAWTQSFSSLFSRRVPLSADSLNLSRLRRFIFFSNFWTGCPQPRRHFQSNDSVCSCHGYYDSIIYEIQKVLGPVSARDSISTGGRAAACLSQSQSTRKFCWHSRAPWRCFIFSMGRVLVVTWFFFRTAFWAT